ncbi:hypothetical protein CN902_26415 [Priestia megaterium]|uniref:hypothetical protein n=1 Tax=Priestia megaterium TaxID=1404 RepID=UPI000BFC49F3|nr:hypothetical protein [Priestia megaterium]PGK22440.1 hypothetical protein CN902_26415 [Priestia megaterium]
MTNNGHDRESSLQPTNEAQEESFLGKLKKAISDLTIDFSEIGVDAGIKKLTENTILNEAPVVKTFIAAIKGGFAVRDWHYAKKLHTFLLEFQSDNYDITNLENYREELKDDKKKQRVVEHLMVIIDRVAIEIKVKVLAKLFEGYLNKDNNINWDRFVALTVCLDSLNPAGFLYLHNMSKTENWNISTINATEGEVLLAAAGLGTRVGNSFQVFDLGRQLYNHGIKYIISEL